jgi:hypothetical protein
LASSTLVGVENDHGTVAEDIPGRIRHDGRVPPPMNRTISGLYDERRADEV